MQCFFEKFRKNFFLIFLFLLKKTFQGIFSCFENVPIYVIAVIKVYDLLLTLLQAISILVV